MNIQEIPGNTCFYIAKRCFQTAPDRALSAILMLNEKDLQTCETINLISDLVLKGDLEQILKDDLFSVKDNKYNFMFYIIKSRIDKVIANEKLIKKCLLSRNK